MPRLTTIALLHLFVASWIVASDDLEIVISAPVAVSAGQQFEITIAVENNGEEPFVFKRHWKWAENTWYLEVEGPDGLLTPSTPGLFDIPADKVCSYFIPLQPGDTYSTPAVINGKWPPSIDLPGSGILRIRLVYVSEERRREAQCSHGGVAIWTGSTMSNWFEVKVESK